MTEKTAKYLRVRLIDPMVFDRRSFRTITLSKDGAKGIIGCPKGEYQPRKKKCRVGTWLQAKLYPTRHNPQDIADTLGVPVASSHNLSREHKMFRRFHDREPERFIKATHPDIPESAICLGKLKSIIYSKDGEDFIHDLKGALLAADKNGKLLIIGDKAKITKRGIVG